VIAFASPLAQYRSQQAEIGAAVRRVLESGSYILGEEVVAFERALAAQCGVAHAVGVASGTDAITLALRALGVDAGDEVITVSHTALATVAAILAAGAIPVLVDVEEDHFTLDPRELEAAVTARTKAIVPVHLYGQAADMEPIMAFAARRGLAVIEDCAQAMGARLGAKALGAFGRAGCFSFYPTKNIGALGDAGAVATYDDGVAERIRRLRQYGWDDQRRTEGIGVNSRLDPLQAAILGVKLSRLKEWSARRREIARRYSTAFAGLPMKTPGVRNGSEHAFHLYVIRTADRDALRQSLAAAGVGTGIHYAAPVHRQRGYAERVRVPASGLPVSERLRGTILSLPLYPELADGDVERVVAAVHAHFAG
jgi:dTDP-4-amino-4,6-dideoxygalactose transaminase